MSANLWALPRLLHPQHLDRVHVALGLCFFSHHSPPCMGLCLYWFCPVQIPSKCWGWSNLALPINITSFIFLNIGSPKTVPLSVVFDVPTQSQTVCTFRMCVPFCPCQRRRTLGRAGSIGNTCLLEQPGAQLPASRVCGPPGVREAQTLC